MMNAPHRALLRRRGVLLAGWSLGWLCVCTHLDAAAALTAPPWLRERWPDAQALGQAQLRFLGLDIYTASLWGRPAFNRHQPLAHEFALELHYHRALKGASIAERSIAEMRRQPAFDETRAAEWQAVMTRVFPDVRADDRLFGMHHPQASPMQSAVSFGLNGQRIAGGDISDALFARLFFGIWLAPETSEPQMRRRLLQLGEGGRV